MSKQKAKEDFQVVFQHLGDEDGGLYGNYDKLTSLLGLVLALYQVFIGRQSDWLKDHYALFNKYEEYQFLIRWLMWISVSAPGFYNFASGKVQSVIGAAKMKYLASFLGDASAIGRNLLIFAYLGLIGWKEKNLQMELAAGSFLLTLGFLIYRKYLKWSKIYTAYKHQNNILPNPEEHKEKEIKEITDAKQYGTYENGFLYGSTITLIYNYAYQAQSKFYSDNTKLFDQFPQYNWIIVGLAYTAAVPTIIYGFYSQYLKRNENQKNARFSEFVYELFQPIRSALITLYLILIEYHLKEPVLGLAALLFIIATVLSALRTYTKWKYYYFGAGRGDYKKWINVKPMLEKEQEKEPLKQKESKKVK